MARDDGRAADELRPMHFDTNFLINARGSVLAAFGNTRVLCAVSVTDGVPRWMQNQGVSGGWLTAEYQMLPASTHTRNQRDSTRGRPNGRSQEIQRLIGRSLRAAVDLSQLGPHTVYVDCDVIDADGGTRCASINGAMVALQLAFQKMMADGRIKAMPLSHTIGAVSVGIVDGEPLLDLCYTEDSAAEVDMNVIMTDDGRFVELQGTAEGQTFSEDEMLAMTGLAKKGIGEIISAQRAVLGD
jgi:ribonuclease PH